MSTIRERDAEWEPSPIEGGGWRRETQIAEGHREQLAILLLVLLLLLMAIIFPRQTGADVPMVPSRIPASEFEPIISQSWPSNAASSPAATQVPRTLTPATRAPSPAPSVPRPVSVAPVRVPTASKAGISGIASWFRSPAGVSAAGPALRTALGPGWRGRQVAVCAGQHCTTVVLGDWCACSGRVIDLDDNQFAQLAPLSRGVVEVSVRW
jgi:hypothetical protein